MLYFIKMFPYFLGIDIGSTKTLGLKLSIDKLLISSKKCNGVNFQREGVEGIIKVVGEVLKELMRNNEKYVLTVGVAGLYRENERRKLARELRERFGLLDIYIMSDAEIAHIGAHEGERGITVIVGTGSIVIAYDGKRWYRKGGYGYLFDDPGSGFYLGKEGIKAAIASLEGWGEKTKLEGLIQNVSGFTKEAPHNVIPIFYSEDGVNLMASLAPKVVELMEEDEVAFKIVRRGIEALSRMVFAVSKSSREKEVRATGGLTGLASYFNMLKKSLGELGFELKPALKSPAWGAALHSHIRWRERQESK